MCKLVAWLPRTGAVAGARTLQLRTAKDHLWIAEVEGREPWILNADHVRRWQTEHRRYLNRISDDTKYEKRWPKRMRANIKEARARRCDKNHRRLQSFMQQTVASLAGYAQRQKVGEVIYDDGEAGYMESFPWFQLRERLKTKLDEVGIAFTHQPASGNVMNESPEPSREE
jgi:hypothetical protein